MQTSQEFNVPVVSVLKTVTMVRCVCCSGRFLFVVLVVFVGSSLGMFGWFGFEGAKGITQLVSDTFGKHKDEAVKANVFSGFLRILGFDSRKIGAIAVNALIFIAQLISASFSRPPPAEITSARTSGSPYYWMMNNSKVPDLMVHSMDKELPNRVIQYVKERSLDEETGCVQLLLCKTAPFVWSMQRALGKDGGRITGRNVLFAFLPSVEEVADHGDACEKIHPYCFFID